jgi:hypothetical protein
VAVVAQSVRRAEPGELEPVGFGLLPVPGRTGVTFGYWNWWIIVLL